MAGIIRRPFTKIFLVGANGFPGMVYGPLLRDLSERYDAEVEVIDAYRKYIPGANWRPMIAEVEERLATTTKEGARKLIIGHSMGAALLINAMQHRDVGSHGGLVLIDPPVFSLRRRIAIKYSLKFNIGPLTRIIASCANRKNDWSSREEAMDYLKNIKPLSTFHPDVLNEFKVFGLVEMPDGRIRLSFPPIYESEIFKWTPQELPRCTWMKPGPTDVHMYDNTDGIPSDLKAKWFISSKNEFSSRRCYHEARVKWSQSQFYEMDSHMAPLENPYGMASLIDEVLNMEKRN